MERAPKRIAKLRKELISLFRNGLGQESADTRKLDDLLEEEVMAVFRLHARIETGKALGMPEGMFTYTGLDDEDEEEEADEELE